MPAPIHADQIAAHNRQFGYAGDISAADAWTLLETRPESVLVDVRTPEEWQQVGVPDLAGLDKDTHLVTWRVVAGGQSGAIFAEDFSQLPVGRDAPVLLICKSGGRSQAAAIALTAAGYGCCLNIAGGFEGPQGWKASKLPGK